MPLNRLPEVTKCCGCVTDLKTAAAIIAVLGIVTSPSVSWAIVRHSYVIRVSCCVTTSTSRADVVDIDLNNIISFGFGSNAGLSPSCLGPKNGSKVVQQILRDNEANSSGFAKTVMHLGWIVFGADVFCLLCSTRFLIRIFKGPDKKAANMFIYAAILTIILSFIYGMLYVASCLTVGGAFPIFEFIFSIVDVVVYFIWMYFLIVIRSYIRAPQTSLEWTYLAALEALFTALNSMYPYMTRLIWDLYYRVHAALRK